jgi:hypothetical protein
MTDQQQDDHCWVIMAGLPWQIREVYRDRGEIVAFWLEDPINIRSALLQMTVANWASNYVAKATAMLDEAFPD